jgi:hypothetical protein
MMAKWFMMLSRNVIPTPTPPGALQAASLQSVMSNQTNPLMGEAASHGAAGRGRGSQMKPL